MTDRYAGIVDELHTRVESLRKDLRLTRIDLREQIEQARLSGREARAELAKWKRIRTPTHGACCTCQACGLDHDSCRCDLDDLADDVQRLRVTLAFAKATCEANGGTLDITFFDGLEV